MASLHIQPGRPCPLASSHEALVRRCVDALDHRGLPWRPLLRSHGLHLSDPPRPDARIPAASEQALLRDAERMADDPLLGWKLGAMEFRDLGVYGYSALNAPDLRSALKLLIERSALVSEAAQLVLRIEGEEAILAQTLSANATTAQVCLHLFACHLRELAGPAFRPLRAGLQRTDTSRLQMLSDKLRVRVDAHDEPITFVSFDAHLLHRPIHRADAHLALTLQPLWEEERAKLALRAASLVRLQDAIAPLLPKGMPTLDRVAAALDISSVALRRELDSLDTSLPRLVDQIRAGLAPAVLGQPGMTLAAAARLLGFGDPRTLVRAHRRWSGTPPLGDRITPDLPGKVRGAVAPGP